MDEEFKNGLLGFMPSSGTAWNGFREAEERRLELRLGPPGQEHHHAKFGYFSTLPNQEDLKEKGSGDPPQAKANNGSQTRPAATTVVGWPPVRSFRRNLASSSKPSIEAQNGGKDAAAKIENGQKCLFVKINMDGVPIGRKVDLKAYNSYDKLSSAVDQLFRGLLAAQKDPIIAATQKSAGEKHTITGLLDGSGEYILVYEDDEGDRMLVGDVPWDMFISTAKRLRVLKSSDLSASSLRTVSRKRAATEC